MRKIYSLSSFNMCTNKWKNGDVNVVNTEYFEKLETKYSYYIANIQILTRELREAESKYDRTQKDEDQLNVYDLSRMLFAARSNKPFKNPGEHTAWSAWHNRSTENELIVSSFKSVPIDEFLQILRNQEVEYFLVDNSCEISVNLLDDLLSKGCTIDGTVHVEYVKTASFVPNSCGTCLRILVGDNING